MLSHSRYFPRSELSTKSPLSSKRTFIVIVVVDKNVAAAVSSCSSSAVDRTLKSNYWLTFLPLLDVKIQ